MERRPREDRRWQRIQFSLVGGVIVLLAACFYLLEQQRDDKLLSESVELTESIDGDIIAATLLEPTITTRHLDLLGQYPGLRRLNLADTTALESSGETLARFQELTSLDLSRTRWLSETMLVEIGRLPNLRNLTLNESNVTDAMLVSVTKSPKLKFLAVQGCSRITDESIETIASLPALELAVLNGTQVSPEGFRRLRFARRDLMIMYTPVLKDSAVELPGVANVEDRDSRETTGVGQIVSSAPRADLEQLLTLPHNWSTGEWTTGTSLESVRAVSLSGPSAAKSMEWLAPRLSALHSIDLPEAAVVQLTPEHLSDVRFATLRDVTSADSLHLIAQMPIVSELVIEVTEPIVADAFLGPTREVQPLDRLSVRGAGLNSTAIRMLSQITAPHSLTIELPASLDPEAFEHLGAWTAVERIFLNGPGVDNPLVAALRQMRALDSLRLELTTPLSPQALLPLRGLPELDSISLDGPGVTDSLVASLAQFPLLEYISVERAMVSDGAVAPLLESAQPPRIFVSETHISPGMQDRLEATRHRR